MATHHGILSQCISHSSLTPLLIMACGPGNSSRSQEVSTARHLMDKTGLSSSEWWSLDKLCGGTVQAVGGHRGTMQKVSSFNGVRNWLGGGRMGVGGWHWAKFGERRVFSWQTRCWEGTAGWASSRSRGSGGRGGLQHAWSVWPVLVPEVNFFPRSRDPWRRL